MKASMPPSAQTSAPAVATGSKRRSPFAAAVVCLFAFATLAAAPPPQEHPKPLPEGDSGIAARYPCDAEIARDPHVLFTEDFEEGSLDAVTARWTEVSNKNGEVLALSATCRPAAPDSAALEMTATRGKNAGGHLWKLFKPGVDVMYARFLREVRRGPPVRPSLHEDRRVARFAAVAAGRSRLPPRRHDAVFRRASSPAAAGGAGTRRARGSSTRTGTT